MVCNLESHNYTKFNGGKTGHQQLAWSNNIGLEAVSYWIVGNLTKKGLLQGTRELLEPSIHFADPRTSWALATTPWFCYWCIMAYFAGCLMSPLYFSYTRPVSKAAARPFLVAFNLVLCVMYASISYEFVVNISRSGFNSILCSSPAPETRSYTPIEYRLARACYWYYLSKFLRMFDTIMFIACHKRQQLNTSHVLHHGLMPTLGFILVRFYPGGHTLFYPMLHSIVHTPLYAYFLIASLGPNYRRFLCWKKWLTQLQLAQFFVMLAHELLSQAIGCNVWKAYLYDMMYAVTGLMIVKYVYVYAVGYIMPSARETNKNASSTTGEAADRSDGKPKLGRRVTLGAGKRLLKQLPELMCCMAGAKKFQ